MTKIKRWLVSLVVTPDRARKIIAQVVSWFLYRCLAKGTWDAVSLLPSWLRKIADFIERWNETELPAEKDALIVDLVKDAVTDEAVDRLVDAISAMAVEEARNGSV